MRSQTVRISSLNDLDQFVALLCKENLAGSLIGLSGQLGAGKTTFVRLLVSALGGDSSQVSSPSYVLEHRYQLFGDKSTGGGVTDIEHWDLYRLNAAPLEMFEPIWPNHIRIVEWIDKFPELISECGIHIKFSVGDAEARVLEVVVR